MKNKDVIEKFNSDFDMYLNEVESADIFQGIKKRLNTNFYILTHKKKSFEKTILPYILIILIVGALALMIIKSVTPKTDIEELYSYIFLVNN